MDHFSAFDVDAHEGHEEAKAARHASILFSNRASERFLGFLRQAAHKDEFEARLALIEGDLGRLATDITDETGHDAAHFVEHYKNHVARGAFCDDCRKWKTGPKSLCTCGSGEGDDDNGEGALSDDVSAVGVKGSSVKVADMPINYDQGAGQPPTKSCDHCGQIVQNFGTHEPCPHCGEMSGDQTFGDFSQQLGQAFLNPGNGGHFGSTSVPFRVVATGEDNLGGEGKPSPKIDKSKAGDERSNKKRKPINTDGGRFKTVHQDVADGPDLADQDFLKQTETVTDHDVDVAKKNEVKPKSTDTWHGTKGQADPVTSHFLSDEEVARALTA